MSVLFNDYKKDIETVISSIELISTWDSIGKIDETDIISIKETDTYQQLQKIKENYIKFQIDQNVIRGSLILYSFGRFEMFVKQLIEDMCIRYIKKVKEFEKLPNDLKKNLIKYTGIVLQNHNKFGYTSININQFISTLNDNINNIQPIDRVNTECLVITEENMRLDVISSLFNRIGAKNVVIKLSEQALVLSFFETDKPEQAANEIKNILNKIVDIRNSIAHPVPSFTWPSKEDVLKYVKFMEKCGQALDEVSEIYVSALSV